MLRFSTMMCCALWLHGAAQAEAAGQAWTAAGADTASTAIGLSAGLVEVNPLGPVGALAVKAAVMGYIQGQPEEARPRMYNFVSSFWGGAAANNLCWLAGAGPVCLLVGAVTGQWIWRSSEDRREAALAAKALSDSQADHRPAADTATPTEPLQAPSAFAAQAF